MSRQTSNKQKSNYSSVSTKTRNEVKLTHVDKLKNIENIIKKETDDNQLQYYPIESIHLFNKSIQKNLNETLTTLNELKICLVELNNTFFIKTFFTHKSTITKFTNLKNSLSKYKTLIPNTKKGGSFINTIPKTLKKQMKFIIEKIEITIQFFTNMIEIKKAYHSIIIQIKNNIEDINKKQDKANDYIRNNKKDLASDELKNKYFLIDNTYNYIGQINNSIKKWDYYINEININKNLEVITTLITELVNDFDSIYTNLKVTIPTNGGKQYNSSYFNRKIKAPKNIIKPTRILKNSKKKHI